jgi:hypothetical protein
MKRLFLFLEGCSWKAGHSRARRSEDEIFCSTQTVNQKSDKIAAGNAGPTA